MRCGSEIETDRLAKLECHTAVIAQNTPTQKRHLHEDTRMQAGMCAAQVCLDVHNAQAFNAMGDSFGNWNLL